MEHSYVYASFGRRLAAVLIDTVLFALVVYPIAIFIFGMERVFPTQATMEYSSLNLVLDYVLPALFSIIFWMTWQATPGKRLLSLKILDAETGHPPSLAQCLIRYVGYFISAIVLLIGYFWVLFDDRKQSWHDKMARTVVVKTVE